MVIGIIGIIIGSIWFLISLFNNPESAPQQTVQYLGFVCGSIFLIGGIILLKVDSFVKTLMLNIGNIYEKLKNIDENFETVYEDKIFEESNDNETPYSGG